jgi:hypothetical protein
MHPFFKLKGIVPGIVHHPRYGDLDFRGKISFDILKDLHETGFVYIELTRNGQLFFNPEEKAQEIKSTIPRVKSSVKKRHGSKRQ